MRITRITLRFMKALVRRALDALPLHQPQVIAAVRAPAGAPEWARWLEEIGFLPGEAVTVVARARPGGDPLVVRIGVSTFALRQAEAACVEVTSVA
jgi:ferrous iron transport protein A